MKLKLISHKLYILAVMTSLAQLQYIIQEVILNNPQDISEHIINIYAKSRLSIYKTAYLIRMEKALSIHYPALKILLGNEKFSTLCHEYMYKYTSPYFSLRWFGDQLAAFLRIPYLAELARFEWLMGLVSDSMNHKPLTFEDMISVLPESWNTLRLTLQPSVYRVNLYWNTAKTWENLIKQKIKNTASRIRIHALKKPQHWIFWRRGQSNQYAKLTAESAWMIDAIIQKLTFGEICEGLSLRGNKKNSGRRAALLLKSFLSAELLSKIPAPDSAINTQILTPKY